MIQLKIAALWQYAYKAQDIIGKWGLRYYSIAIFIVVIFLVIVSAHLAPAFQGVIEAHFDTDLAVELLRNLVLGTGCALIGAAVIVTTLVLFAMQVNIERMPWGLFRRLSADLKLLSAFGLSFLLAIGIATLSMFIVQAALASVVLGASWAIVFMLILFLYAYQRALTLINPLQQLDILIRDTRKEFQIWARRAQREMPLFEPEKIANTTPPSIDPTHDLARTIYFLKNNHWTDSAKRSIRHAMSIARRYAEQGDHEVSWAALSAVIDINAAYIDTKGRTFYVNDPFVDNCFTHDGFINETLDYLRQNAEGGIGRRDEQQIKQILQTIAALVRLYSTIDYSIPYATKSHALIAAKYLSSVVETVVHHNMADVLLEGQRLMGQSAQYILAHGDPNGIVRLSEKIALIACTGCAKEDYRPVTMEGMTQLANLTFKLLWSRTYEIDFAVGALRGAVALVVKLFLNVADTPFTNNHSTFLGPYYSSTSTQSLRSRLLGLVNILSKAQPDNAVAQSVVRNIERWAEDLYQTEKELLLAAINAKSHFVFDMIHWITGVTEMLLAVSNAPACDHRIQEELRRHALWLIWTLDWIPDDKETVSFVKNFQMTETLFKAAMDAHNWGCNDIAKQVGKILLNWTFKGGRYQTVILERGLCGLAAFALMDVEEGIFWIRTEVTAQLMNKPMLEQKTLSHVAKEILKRASNPYEYRHCVSPIDMVIARSDHEKLGSLLEEIAGLLSPQSI